MLKKKLERDNPPEQAGFEGGCSRGLAGHQTRYSTPGDAAVTACKRYATKY